ncbi:MAG TPA: hypothetical protein VES59_03220 [Bacteroidota bacterium]|nr:hypothetical protein [Bacteroidota bacterium]
MRRDEEPRRAVILSGGGWPGAYDIVRALGLAGVKSIVVSSQPDDIAFHSRYVEGRINLPEFQPCQYGRIADALEAIGTSEREKPVLFYVGDAEVAFVQQFRDRLREYFRFLLPEDRLTTTLLNKSLFYEFARGCDLPVPSAESFSDVRDLRKRIGAVAFPCIVKPSFNQDWFWKNREERDRLPSYKQALRRFGSKDDLLEFADALPERASGFVVQSYIDGGDDAITSFHGYFNEQSECLGYFLGREIRTNPPHTGESAYSRTIYNESLAKRSIDYLRRIGMRGIVKIDYKLDARTNDFKMMEIEPHFQFWHLLGAYAGVNLPLIAYRHQRDERVAISGSYADDLRMLYFLPDIRAFWGGYRKSGEWALVPYLKSFMKKKYYRVFDPLDPLPFVRSVMGLGGRILKHLPVRLAAKSGAIQVRGIRPQNVIVRELPQLHRMNEH